VYKGAAKVFLDNEVVHYEIYNKLDKIFFFTKIIKAVFKFRKINKELKYDYIHAHTLISDGLVGLSLSLLSRKPLIVTVRNTDVNYFIPNFIFKFLGKLVIRRAKLVIFLSP